MNLLSKNKCIRIYFPSILLIITTIFFYFLNKEFIFSSDDLYYSTNLTTGKSLTNISDIFQSQIWHYFNWGGRTVAHTFLQFTLMMGETYANITNIMNTILLVFIIGVIARQKKLWDFLLIISLLIICNPRWDQTLFWEAGFANYVYTIIFVLLFLFQYLRIIENPTYKKPFGINIWIIPLGLFAGWSNENIGPTIWLCSLGMIIYLLYQKKAVPLFTILGNLFCLIGSILIIISPGNQVRLAENYVNVTYGMKMKIFLRFYHVGVAIFDYLLAPILILCFVLFIYLVLLKLKLTITDIVFISAAALSIGAMLLSPHYPDRATFGTLVFIIITILHLLGTMALKYKPRFSSYYLLVFFLWTGMIFLLIELIMNMHGLIPYA